jgi:hypothetical protein
LGDGKARILNPTSRIIFTLAHAYVHELRGRRAGTPFRDLYDATLMTRSLDREIDWRRVKDTFDRAGEAEGLRVAGMMWRRLFSENPPGGIDPPRWGRIYWQRCLLKIRSARWGIIGDHLAQNVRALGTAFSGTAEGKQMREEFSKPAALRRKLRTALRLYSPPRGQGGGHGTGQ